MSENLQKRPAKGILKNSSSFDKHEDHSSAKRSKETKWDEMNIIATYHPPGKDYGHMKIDEPKTPYNYESDMQVDQPDNLNPEELADRIKIAADKPPKFLEPESDSSDDEEITEEEKRRRREFELKRKKHYNEFQALQLAKKLLEQEDEDRDDDNEAATSSGNPTEKGLSKK